MTTKSIFPLAAGVLLASASHAAIYDEGMQGDLSDDRLAPTPFALESGSNFLSGSVTSADPDRDYFTVVVPTGLVLSQLILRRYESANTRAFIGMQEGSTFTLPASAISPAGLLGYLHFGFDFAIPGDVLDDLSLSVSPGFSIPLPAGHYSFWVNQTEPALTTYEFDFKTAAVPEPATGLTVVGGLGMLLVLGCRRA